VNSIIKELNNLPFPVYLHSYSALDLFFRHDASPCIKATVEVGLVELARTFPNLVYPGLDDGDAEVDFGGYTVRFRCIENIFKAPVNRISVLNIFYDVKNRKFLDPYSIYRDIRAKELRLIDNSAASISPERITVPDPQNWKLLADSAVLISRYHYNTPKFPLRPTTTSTELSCREQKDLLIFILTGKNPLRGLNLLMNEGFMRIHWPEIEQMNTVPHSKDYHPEGNVWQHTMETFYHRKKNDLTLSLALLLHDVGKPLAQQNEGRRFDRHAQIGNDLSKRFLRRLGFDSNIVENVAFLVKEHMFPPAVEKLPHFKTERVMSSTLFPLLLEIYRCDLSSAFRSLENYYKACRVYRSFLKNSRNPFRTNDGRKLLRLYVEG